MELPRKHVDRASRKIKTLKRRSVQKSRRIKSYFTNTTIPADSEWSDIEDDESAFETNLGSDFCVETFNNRTQNVLFKIYPVVLDINIEYDDENSSNVDSEEDWYTNNEIAKFEIVGSLRLTETTIRSRDNLPRRQYLIIKELIDTEETYLKNMKHIIDNYLQHFRKLAISSDIEKVFCNIEEIHEATDKVCFQMKECVSVEEIASIFLENVHLFQCYTKYIRNKSDSYLQATEVFDEHIKARQIELGDGNILESYLVNPVQRPGRYKLLLENLAKAVRTNGEQCVPLQKAIKFIDQKITEANTLMVIDSIQHCPIDLRNMGTYLMQDTFNVKGKHRREVVLFEKCVIFCKAAENNSSIYNYYDHIEMDKLSLRYVPNALTFYLASYDKLKNATNNTLYEINLEALSADIQEKWISEIHRILWDQLQYHKDHNTKQNLRSRNNEMNEDNIRYYDMGRAAYDENSSKEAGTFFDKNKNIRIELMASNSQKSQQKHIRNAKEKHMINELINSEQVYLEELKSNIDYYEDYCESVVLPWYMLENIKDIYLLTQNLLSKFLECNSIDSFAKIFLDNINLFDSYKKYIRNRETFYRYTDTKFENINNYVLNTQAGIKDEHGHNINLLDPLKNLEKYKQSLEQLEKELAKIGEINQALNDAIISVNGRMREIYSIAPINSIQYCPFNLKKMGFFVMKEIFKTEYKYNQAIFLFEEIIIFCTEDKNHPDTYIYEDSIQTRKLKIIYSTNFTSFKLTNANKSEDDIKDIFTIETFSISTKEKWINAIKVILWGQLQYFKVKEAVCNKTGEHKAKEFYITNRDDRNKGELKKRWTIIDSKTDKPSHFK